MPHLQGNLYFTQYTLEEGDPRQDLANTIGDCAAKYEAKHGVRPNQALIHPRGLTPQPGWIRVEGVRVDLDNAMLPGHLWLTRNPALDIPRPESRAAKALRGLEPAPAATLACEVPVAGVAERTIKLPAALVARERPGAPLLPAPGVWVEAQRTEERQALSQYLHTMRATREEYISTMQVYEGQPFVFNSRLLGGIAGLEKPRTQGYYQAIRHLQALIDARKRQQRTERRARDLVARFQLEYEALSQPPLDTILPESGRVVRAHWFVTPGGAVLPALDSPLAAKPAPQQIPLQPGQAPPIRPATPVMPGFPVKLGQHTINKAGITVHHSAMDKSLRVTYWMAGLAGKQTQNYPVSAARQGEQVLLDSRSATRSLIPLAEWQAFADTLEVKVSSVSINTILMSEPLIRMARDVIAYRRKAPTDAEWAAEMAHLAPPVATDADRRRCEQPASIPHTEIFQGVEYVYTIQVDHGSYLLAGDGVETPCPLGSLEQAKAMAREAARRISVQLHDHEYAQISSARDVRAAIRQFERAKGRKPTRIEVPLAPAEALRVPHIWQVPLVPTRGVKAGHVKLVAERGEVAPGARPASPATPDPNRVRSAPAAACERPQAPGRTSMATGL